MVDKNKFKMEGLKFGRLLQSVFRLSSMFTVNHRAADGAVKQSYEALNALVKQVQQFTFGFLDHRVLLNNILTPDRSLRILESDFSKRGLGAVTFPAGITLGGYRNVLSVICATLEEIERHGGIKRFFEENIVEGVRIIPGAKGTSSTEETVLEGDPESLLAAQTASFEGGGPPMGLDLLLEAVGMSSGPGGGSGAGHGMDGGAGGFGAGGGGGSGAGTGGFEAGGGSGSGAGTGGFGAGGGGGSGTGAAGFEVGGGGAGAGAGGFGTGGGGGSGAGAGGFEAGAGGGPGAGGGGFGAGSGPGGGGFGGSGGGVAGGGLGGSSSGSPGPGGPGVPGPGGPGGTGGLGGIGSNTGNPAMWVPASSGGGGLGNAFVPPGSVIAAPGYGLAKVAGAAVASNATQALDLAEKAIIRTLSYPNADPTQALNALSRMLEDFDPSVLLPALSPEKRELMKGKKPREIATDLMEDVTVQYAVNRLANPGKGPIEMAEEDVIRILQKSLDATHTVDRMLSKLSRLFEKAQLPPEFYARIQHELRWVGLPAGEKYKQLMALPRYTSTEFKRLMSYVKEAVAKNKFDEATGLANHYFAVLDLTETELQPAELARAPELIQAVARLQTRDYMQSLSTRLTTALLDEHLSGWFHNHIANCLATMAHSMAPYEDFESVQKIAVEMEKSRLRDPERHEECCGDALGDLLGPRTIERLIEVYAEKRDSQRMVLSILKLMGRPGIEKVFQRLEEEKKASNRMALIRLISQSGQPAIDAARQRLNDERWYVVRNACYVLSEMRDPALSNEMRTVLKHTDERVQQAALSVITKSAAPDRAEVLADSLPFLKPQVLETALDELRFWKSPGSVKGLEQFLSQENGKPLEQDKAMTALLAVPEDGAIDALAHIFLNQANSKPIRRRTIAALSKSGHPAAYQALTEVASRAPHDPLAAESQKALEIE